MNIFAGRKSAHKPSGSPDFSRGSVFRGRFFKFCRLWANHDALQEYIPARQRRFLIKVISKQWASCFRRRNCRRPLNREQSVFWLGTRRSSKKTCRAAVLSPFKIALTNQMSWDFEWDIGFQVSGKKVSTTKTTYSALPCAQKFPIGAVSNLSQLKSVCGFFYRDFEYFSSAARK